MAKILDGRVVRNIIAADLTKKIKKIKTKPKLVIIQVGDLAQSNSYIKQKILFGEKIGAIVELKKLKEDFSQLDLEVMISNFNSDDSIHGIIVQMPIPKDLDKDTIINKIAPEKDVDGLTATNIKLLLKNKRGGYPPATTKGILTLLYHYQIPIHGRNITVVGRSSLVGKPTAMALMNLDATVTVCHSKTKKLPHITKNADILIVATGKAKLIKDFHVNKDQVVIDVGINTTTQNKVRPSSGLLEKPESELPKIKLTGDVDFKEVSKIVSAISPVPGGIGPMTVASLFQNLLEAYKQQSK